MINAEKPASAKPTERKALRKALSDCFRNLATSVSCKLMVKYKML